VIRKAPHPLSFAPEYTRMSKVAVFDLDGTLADTAPDMMDALNYVLAAEGLPALAEDLANCLIGAGARNLVVRGFEMAGSDPRQADEERRFQAFMERYEKDICRRTRLFPDVVQALDGLAADGYVFGVCTNKTERQSRMLLEALGILDRFKVVCGGDSLPWRKPDPRPLAATIERVCAVPRFSVMIGDSGIDVETARSAGVPVIAVSFGYTERPVAEYGPDALIDGFGDLRRAVRALSQGN